MNSDIWDRYLTILTADFGVEPYAFDHLNDALAFIHKCDIDKQGKTFLDIGCCNTYLKGKLQSIWVGIELAHTHNPNISQGDIHCLENIQSEFADIVFASHVLEHTLAPIVALFEMKRVMKHNGDMIIVLPVYPGYMYNGHNYMMPAESWIHLFKRVELKIEHRQDNSKNDTVVFHLKNDK